MEKSELLGHQRQRCKVIGQVVFRFTFYKKQIDTISYLSYEQTDLLFLAKTGFGKSIIFQLLPFMTTTSGAVFILILLKLLQAEQSRIINQIPNKRELVINSENNHKHVYKQAAKGGYIHIFTSPEIVLSKKFKKNILDDPEFTDRFCLLVVDEIHLIDQWEKAFHSLYTKIEKVWKKIPCNVLILGISATLTKQAQTKILDKAKFRTGYCLMQISLDRPEIMQIHQFLEYTKAICLDLQFIPSKTANEIRNIQKTIIFMNSISEICPLINIIVGWMRKLRYLDCYSI